MAAPSAGEIIAVRREAIGDYLDETTLSDGDISYFWGNGGGSVVTLTAAVCCEMLANKAAQHFGWAADGQRFDMQQRQKQYRDNAIELRRRYFGSGTITITRTDDVGSASEYTV